VSRIRAGGNGKNVPVEAAADAGPPPGRTVRSAATTAEAADALTAHLGAVTLPSGVFMALSLVFSD